MSFCINCGQELSDNMRYCFNCGTPTLSGENKETRKEVYEGELHKCPNCGELLESFVSTCPSCNYELRGTKSANSIQNFLSKLEQTTSVEQKSTLIRNFPIPNTKEDIFEFMILASTNIKRQKNELIFNAWLAKFEQCYKKASLSFVNEPDYEKFQMIYNQTIKTINKEKIVHGVNKGFNGIHKILLWVNKIIAIASKTISSFPNPVLAISFVLLSIYIIIRLFSGRFSGTDIIIPIVILAIVYMITEIKEESPQNNNNDMVPNKNDNINDIDNILDITISKKTTKIKVPDSIVNGKIKNYDSVKALLIQAGFTNVVSIPLKDLIKGVFYKPNTVDSITFNGKNLSSYYGTKFKSDIPIVIYYHSF